LRFDVARAAERLAMSGLWLPTGALAALVLRSLLVVPLAAAGTEAPPYACDVAQRGFHVLRREGCGVLVWRDALRTAEPIRVAVKACPPDFAKLPGRVDQALQLHASRLEPYQQPWRYFSPRGQPLDTEASWKEALSGDEVGLGAGVVFLLEGGQFQWPPVSVGFRQPVGDGVVLETLALQPPIFRVIGLLSSEEADALVDFARPRLSKASKVWAMNKKPSDQAQVRNSTDYRPRHNETPLIESLERRAAALTRMPFSHLEAPQIVSYGKGGYYYAHDDAGRIEYYHKDDKFMKGRHYGYFSRMLTLFWYLSDVPSGGETNFPRADTDALPKTMRKCEQGLWVRPESTHAVLWYNLDATGWVNPRALHAACVVEEGEKYAMNIWIRNKPSSTAPAKWDPGHPRLVALLEKAAAGGRRARVNSEL